MRSLHTTVGVYAEFDGWQNSCEHEIGVRLHTGWLFSDLQERCPFLAGELDEKVATLHLPALGVTLTVFSQEHAVRIGFKVEFRFRSEHYRF